MKFQGGKLLPKFFFGIYIIYFQDTFCLLQILSKSIMWELYFSLTWLQECYLITMEVRKYKGSHLHILALFAYFC